ncbi:SGNH/GDSL hydrolase family protein [Actinocorallia longicatena]|uniref:SGNH/GDSL hydrolase family protein n=1 Tax=Actinocorallia longicatena TaxID=111803 RepID=A0ABP6QPJ0_9ACTN
MIKIAVVLATLLTGPAPASALDPVQAAPPGSAAISTAAISTAAISTAALDYAALGDSVAAGPLIPRQHGPAVCRRSDHNYPSLIAGALRPATFTDVSCTGAELKHLSTSQSGLPPQLEALSDDTDLVTITLGANSVSWSKVALNCGLISIGTLGHGNPCQLTQGKAVLKKMVNIRPKIDAAYRKVREAAPNARIVVVGYLKVAPGDGKGCWPRLPLAKGDQKFFDAVERELNAMLKTTATKIGATYLDAYALSDGHDVCAKEPWTSGLKGPSLVYHPTARGMERVAAAVVASLAAPVAATSG